MIPYTLPIDLNIQINTNFELRYGGLIGTIIGGFFLTLIGKFLSNFIFFISLIIVLINIFDKNFDDIKNILTLMLGKFKTIYEYVKLKIENSISIDKQENIEQNLHSVDFDNNKLINTLNVNENAQHANSSKLSEINTFNYSKRFGLKRKREQKKVPENNYKKDRNRNSKQDQKNNLQLNMRKMNPFAKKTKVKLFDFSGQLEQDYERPLKTIEKRNNSQSNENYFVHVRGNKNKQATEPQNDVTYVEDSYDDTFENITYKKEEAYFEPEASQNNNINYLDEQKIAEYEETIKALKKEIDRQLFLFQDSQKEFSEQRNVEKNLLKIINAQRETIEKQASTIKAFELSLNVSNVTQNSSNNSHLNISNNIPNTSDTFASSEPATISPEKTESNLNITEDVKDINPILKTQDNYVEISYKPDTIPNDSDNLDFIVNANNIPQETLQNITKSLVDDEYNSNVEDSINDSTYIQDSDSSSNTTATTNGLYSEDLPTNDVITQNNSSYTESLTSTTNNTSSANSLNQNLGNMSSNKDVVSTSQPSYESQVFEYSQISSNVSTPPSNSIFKSEDEPVYSKPIKPHFEKPTEQKYVYTFPTVDFLNEKPNATEQTSKIELIANSKKLEATLKSFGVVASVNEVSKGPSVTRYEIQPGPGVKVSKIANLSDDLALNLAAKSIRIQAPIPGKRAVGIEVPNETTETVFLREVLDDENFKNFKSKLAFGIGKDISGKIVVSDLATMPHLLIAGATGSGKSVCVNTLITSIVYKSSPDEVKLLMIDPKVVELSVYNGIPHLLIPVVTDPKKASASLNWAVREMEKRYKLFADKNVRDLKGYNEAMKQEGGPLEPQIVIIIDELADLMMTASKEVEAAIIRIAQMARAAGIHLIIATQRPTADVITGLIKSNIPSRLAFSVSSGLDSKIILDETGAEKLLGKGDMLFKPMGSPEPYRIQGAFISDKEVESIVSFLKTDTDHEQMKEIIEEITSTSNPKNASNSPSDTVDEIFEEVVDFIITKQKASTSLIQRQFRVGFNRAARIIDELENFGVIGPDEGNKPRKVLMSMSEWNNKFRT